MASTSSQTQSSASTTLLPTSLSEAQELLAGIKSKSTLPSFSESPEYQKLLDGEYVPPILSSQSSPDYDGSSPLPSFLYPRALVPFSFPQSSQFPLSVASGLDLFCSARMTIRSLQASVEASSAVDSDKLYEAIEEVAPFLHQWGIPLIIGHLSWFVLRRSANKTPHKEDLSDAPKASSSKKKVEKPLPKPKQQLEESRVSPESEESVTPSYQIKCVRLPPRLRRAAKGKACQTEVLDIEESETEEEVIPPPSKRLKSSKSAPASSKASKFHPALLIDDQGRLKLPGDSVEGFAPFKQIEHARNSAPLHCQNPIFDVNPEFLDLGVILTTQKASFTMQDLLQINCTIRDPAIPAQACVSALSQGEFNPNSSRLPGLKYVDLAMDALNVLHVATTSSTLNLTNSLRRAQELCTQLDGLSALFDQVCQSFLQSFMDLQLAGQDPIVVLEALKAAKPQCESISVEDWTVLATLFQWSSPFNLNGLKFDNRTPAEWIDLLRSIHSGASSATITSDGHLVDAFQPPEPVVEDSEDLDTQGSLPITIVEKDSGVEDIASLPEGSPIQTELDLPQIESLTESTPSPEKGI
ncbi:hypothetical protein GG344DRAFT_83478 [Lentinula edodes]|nr:hypothetical protein GG344DRAFT_83478 [Lentinula edodes]